MRSTLIVGPRVVVMATRMQHGRLLPRWGWWISHGERLRCWWVEVGVCASIQEVLSAVKLGLGAALGTGRRWWCRCGRGRARSVLFGCGC